MKPKTHDRRRVSLENVLSQDYIPFLGGRPEREEVIGANDIINLKIALNTFQSLENLFFKV